MKLKIAVVGATGAVGREMIEDLAESTLQEIEVGLFASSRSAGEVISFRGKPREVQIFEVSKLKGYDFCLMSAGGDFSRQYAKAIVEAGVTVIDNSSAWRMDPELPLIVPEVNGSVLKKTKLPTIIANPNCSTIQMVVALKPLMDHFGIEMIQVATYQSVSGTGQKGVIELSEQVEQHYKFQDLSPKVYAQPIAFNVLPAIDKLDPTGHCYEEIKMIKETKKIMGRDDFEVFATTARVPTFNCHCEAVTVKLKKKVTQAEALESLRNAQGIRLVEDIDHALFPTPREVAGQREVFVSRVRLPFGETSSPWVQLWVVADNLKKGAASNAVQILENLQSH